MGPRVRMTEDEMRARQREVASETSETRLRKPPALGGGGHGLGASRLSARSAEEGPRNDLQPLQGRFEVAQRSSVDDEEELQMKAAPPPRNSTGMPYALKAGVESLSGVSLDDVRVHYDSSRPTQLN